MIEREYTGSPDWHTNHNTEDEGTTAMVVLRPFHTDIDFKIKEGSLHEEAVNSLYGLRRLEKIYQLSHLRLVGKHPELFRDYGLYHTRFEHSLHTAITMEDILKQNDFSQQQISTGTVAALVHDIATPAGGDATKKLDQENLHEEDHWREMMEDEESQAFLHRHCIPPDEIDDIIHNKGLLGEILDIADKVAYTTYDAFQIGNYHMAHPDKPIPHFVTPSEDHMFQAFKKSQDVGDIVNDLRIDPESEEVYFTNPERLIALLKNRAHLFRNIYMHPYNQAQDMLFTDLLRPLYSPDETDKLNPSELRQLEDWELVQAINDYWSPPYQFVDLRSMMDNFHPQTINAPTREEAEEITDELQNDTSIIVMGINKTPHIKSGTNWKVHLPKTFGTIHTPPSASLENAYPQSSEEIQSILSAIPPYSVAYYERGNSEFDELIKNVYHSHE